MFRRKFMLDTFRLKFLSWTILCVFLVVFLVNFIKKNLYDIELEKTKRIAYQIYSFVHSIPSDIKTITESNVIKDDEKQIITDDEMFSQKSNKYYIDKFNYLLTIIQNLKEFYSIEFKTEILNLDTLYKNDVLLAKYLNNNIREYLEIIEENNYVRMKVALPLVYKRNCTVCHTNFNYKENNLIGVLNVTYEPTLLKKKVKISSYTIITLFTLIWLAISIFLYLEELKIKRNEKKYRDNQNELNEIKVLFENFIKLYPDSIIYRDHQGKWIKANDLALKLFNLTEFNYQLKTNEELMQDASTEVKELLKKCSETDKIVLTTKNAYRNIETFIFDEQKKLYLEVTKIPVLDSNSDIKGIFIIVRDITSIKEIEEKLIKNQEFLKVLLDSLPVGIFVKDKHLKYIGFNKYFKELFEINESEFIGKTVFEMWDHDLASVYHMMDQELINNPDKIQVYEYVIKRKDGQVREGIFYKSVLRDLNGNIEGIIGAFSDITELKQQQRELKKFKTIINQMTDSVIIANSNKIIEYINDTFKYLRKVDEKNIIGKSLIEFFNKENYNIDLDSIWTDLSKGTKWTGEFTSKREGKTSIDEEISIIPIIEQNDLTHIVIIIRDITEKKLAHRNILQAQKLESIGKLASGIAHEFNNMLSIIQGNIELLQLKLRNIEQIKNQVNNIQKTIDRGSNIIRQLLTFTSSSNNQFSEVDLNQLIKELKPILRDLLTPHTKLEMILQDNLPKIRGNPTNLNQIIINICMNSIDAMPNGGTLTIKTQRIFIDNTLKEYHILGIFGEFVKLTIEDTGIGMTQDVLNRIFDPFFTTKEFGKGTGLGLYIVYWLVQNHNAKIDVTSTPNKGTTFNIYFPIEKETTIDLNKSSLRILSKPKQDSEAILLVEDDEKLRDVILELLKMDNYEVLTASSVIEALDIFSSNSERIKLILSDFMFSDGNAIDLFTHCKKQKQSVKFILMTGYLDIREEFPELEFLNAKLLIKPFKISELRKAISELMLQ